MIKQTSKFVTEVDIEAEGTKTKVDRLFKDNKDASITLNGNQVTFEHLTKNWGDYKNIDAEHIKSIKHWIANPIESALIVDKNNQLDDGNHRLLAAKIKGDEFIYTTPKSNKVFGDMDLLPIDKHIQFQTKTKPSSKPKFIKEN